MNTIRKHAATAALTALALVGAPAAIAGEALAGPWLATQFSTTHADGRMAPAARQGHADGHAFAHDWLARQLTTGHTRPVATTGAVAAMAGESDFVRLWLHRQFAPDHTAPRG